MPVIPRFFVKQDSNMIYVVITIPYVRVSDMEFYINGCDFSFWCKPYLLKLRFPAPMVDDDRAKAVYDMNKDQGTITVQVAKLRSGEHFHDLDFLTSLLQPTKVKSTKNYSKGRFPSVSVVDKEDKKMVVEENLTNSRDCISIAGDNVLQKNNPSLLEIEKDLDSKLYNLSISKPKYGFNNRFEGVFSCWHGEESEIVALPYPDETPSIMRKSLRLAKEEEDFDMERYVLDYLYASYDQQFIDAMSFITSSSKCNNSIVLNDTSKSSSVNLIEDCVHVSPVASDMIPSNNEVASFSEEEMDLMRQLPNRNYIFDANSSEMRMLLCGLVDILIASAYDFRLTNGDRNIESSWTISILSSVLSWLDCSETDMKGIVRSSLRRILCYPYLRHFELGMKCIWDVCTTLKLGKHAIVKTLLQLYKIMERSESKYLLCKLFLEDYCVWVQSVSATVITDICEELELVLMGMSRFDLGLPVKELEDAILAD